MTENIKQVTGTVINMFIIVLIYLVQDMESAICPVHRIWNKGIEKENISIDY